MKKLSSLYSGNDEHQIIGRYCLSLNPKPVHKQLDMTYSETNLKSPMQIVMSLEDSQKAELEAMIKDLEDENRLVCVSGVCLHVCLLLCVCTCVFVGVCVLVCACLLVCLYVCMCTCCVCTCGCCALVCACKDKTEEFQNINALHLYALPCRITFNV